VWGSQINFDVLRFQNIMCFNARFFGAWLICGVFILCFGFEFLLVIGESYLILNHQSTIFSLFVQNRMCSC